MRLPLLVGVSLAIAISVCTGQALKVGATFSQNWALWQTSPSVFTESNNWAGPTVSIALGWLSISTAASVMDLQSLRLTVPPFFCIDGRLAPAIFPFLIPYVKTGVVFTPTRRGYVAAFSGGMLIKPLPNTEVEAGLVWATLVGASMTGTVIGYEFSLTFFFLRL